MKFIHRLGFYLGGFVIGIIILMFFLSGKKTSCDYGPESRTLKNLRSKRLLYSQNALIVLSSNQIDTSLTSALLVTGSVIFSESNTKLDSCKQYVIEGKVFENKLKMRVENCNTKATIMEVFLNE